MAETFDVSDIGTFVALGHTFASHRQYGRSPEWPILWTVPSCSIVAEGEAIHIPDYVEQVVPGAELAVVIGDHLWQANEEEARDGIEGFTISNDVRVKGRFPGYPYGDAQEHAIGRGYHILPTFSPTLTSYVPLDAEAANSLDVTIRIDNETIFTGSTSEMDWDVGEIVQHVSRIIELENGDVLSLGDASDPTTYLEDADSVECEIEELGVLKNPIVTESSLS